MEKFVMGKYTLVKESMESYVADCTDEAEKNYADYLLEEGVVALYNICVERNGEVVASSDVTMCELQDGKWAQISRGVVFRTTFAEAFESMTWLEWFGADAEDE